MFSKYPEKHDLIVPSSADPKRENFNLDSHTNETVGEAKARIAEKLQLSLTSLSFISVRPGWYSLDGTEGRIAEKLQLSLTSLSSISVRPGWYSVDCTETRIAEKLQLSLISLSSISVRPGWYSLDRY